MTFLFHIRNVLKKNNFMAPFCGWGSTASRLQSLRGGSLLFTIQFPEITFKLANFGKIFFNLPYFFVYCTFRIINGIFSSDMMVIHDQTLIPPIQVLLSSYTHEMQIIAINDQYRLIMAG